MTAFTPTARPASVRLRALGTDCAVVSLDPSAAEQAVRLVTDHLALVDRTASRFRADSELSRLTVRAERAPVVAAPASTLLIDLLTAALRAADLTDGLVTPLVGGAVSAAGYDRDFVLVRGRRVATTAGAPVADWRSIRIDHDARTVSLPAGALIDLGASAKAATADTLAASLADRLSGGFLVDLGGDLAAAGTAPGDGWAIGVEDHQGREIQRVRMANNAFATSSTAVRTWRTEDGMRMHHIIDPRTGRPANAVWSQVTVAARTALEANAASTAAIILGEAAPRWLTRNGLPALLQGRSGVRISTPGWPV